MKSRRRLRTIYWRVLLPLLLLIVLLTAMFGAVLRYTGVLDRVRRNAIEMFEEKASNRKNYLLNEMLSRWSNLADEERELAAAMEAQLLAGGNTAADMREDWELNAAIIESLAPRLIEILRLKQTTGIFLVLNGAGVNGDPASRAAIYVRDADPASNTSNNTDLALMRGLPSLARSLDLSLASFWETACVFEDAQDPNAAFYFNPLRSAQQTSRVASRYFGYWSDSFHFAGETSDVEIITYSMPVVGEDGAVYGVLGVDIATSYLARMLDYDEIADDKQGVYVLGYTEDGGETYRVACANGSAYHSYFSGERTLRCEASGYGGLMRVSSEKGVDTELLASVQPLGLYDRNTPFENQQWALIAIAPHESLLGFSTQFRNMLLLCGVLMLGLGLLAAVFASRSITKPISSLVGELKNSNPDKAILLSRTKILEIDELSASIEQLSQSVAESSSRISKIITMAQIALGVFEYQKSTDLAFCSENLFSVMGWKGWNPEKMHYTGAEMRALFQDFHRHIYDEEARVYQIQREGEENPSWVQVNLRNDGDLVLGVILDVTDDVVRKRKIEYERDYDTLTNTLNRRAFQRKMEELFEDHAEKLKTAAVIMLDLDNLKYLNDKYGHDCGDRYIQAFSEQIHLFEQYKGVVSRRSGDEFNVLLYGFNSKEEAREVIHRVWRQIQSAELELPTGEIHKIRASGGIAWYPDDAQNPDELVRYADFAMYSVKRSTKGELAEFDPETYQADAILIDGSEALNRLIEEELVKYALQPIVDTSGEIYGYEMLMRPQMREFSTPAEVLRLAKEQSKMQHIERLTWENALRTFDIQCRNGRIGASARVFINSTSSHVLPAAIQARLKEEYPHLLPRVVLEVTESEQQSESQYREKLAMVRQWGGMIALDDFGAGYNSELKLLSCEPNIIKIDVSLIHDIDKDENRKQLIGGIITYAKAMGMQVLADGVETFDEMRTLVQLGVALLQGFFIARPDMKAPEIKDDVIDLIRGVAGESPDGGK